MIQKNTCSIADLRKLEVVNLCNGCILGNISDVELDLCGGFITAILIPKRIELFELFKKDCKRYYRIPWCQIERIGSDTVLVRYEE